MQVCRTCINCRYIGSPGKYKQYRCIRWESDIPDADSRPYGNKYSPVENGTAVCHMFCSVNKPIDESVFERRRAEDAERRAVASEFEREFEYSIYNGGPFYEDGEEDDSYYHDKLHEMEEKLEEISRKYGCN